ncbi:ribosome biogenesis GTP-binding protein YihA/YsxC [bacterium]|nr:ribosome biogenesis GTP-binding protein YihA/YsxC [bacterium]
MKVTSADYIKSFTNVGAIDLKPLPSIAFIGRSNVGKSSLINHLLNRKKLVKTSSTPGKTQLINYFLINGEFYFVDLPGYGFANVPLSVKNSWSNMINDFLVKNRDLKLIIQLVDIRHKPSKEDFEFQVMVRQYDLPFLVIANKVDKVKKNQIQTFRKDLKQLFTLDSPPIIHSATKRIGQTDIWKEIDTRLF